MKKRSSIILYTLAVCLIMSALTGCDYLLKREFVFLEDHESAPQEVKVSSQMTTISDYNALQQTLYAAVEAHSSTLSVKLLAYSGDVEQDVQDAISNVMSTNLAIYGVDEITYENSSILSYNEIKFTISYNKTQEQFYEISSVSSMTQFKAVIGECLKSFGTEVTLELHNLDLSNYNLDNAILDVYYSNPFYAIGLIGYDITYYPIKNKNCIMNIQFEYSDSYSALTTKRLQTEEAFNRIIEAYSGRDNDRDKLKYIHDTLCENCTCVNTSLSYNIHKNITPDDTFTMYGALVKGEACSFGYSLAMSAFCDYLNISSMLVNGSADGFREQWNMVYINYSWYHVDCAADDVSDDIYGYGSFCVPDKIMDHYYTWPADKHGSCTTSNVRYNYDFPEETKWLSRYNLSGIEPGSMDT